ncbi:MAG: HAD family hydrolase [Hymenobacteraceae bacterium]|nr:HAD family hydrolase [Hymenobacteraceae bacterium]
MPISLPYPAAGPHRAVFLDRDGVLNRERGDYTWRVEDFEVLPDVPDALARLHAAGFRLVVVTNQAGVAKGLYSLQEVDDCHQKLQAAVGGLIDAFYVAPNYPAVSESLGRKPGALLLEKAIARFELDPAQCWFVGDRGRDMAAGQRVGVRTIRVGAVEVADNAPRADFYAVNLGEATDLMLAENASAALENTFQRG